MYDYLSMPGLKSLHVSKRGPRWLVTQTLNSTLILPINRDTELQGPMPLAKTIQKSTTHTTYRLVQADDELRT